VNYSKLSISMRLDNRSPKSCFVKQRKSRETNAIAVLKENLDVVGPLCHLLGNESFCSSQVQW